MAISVYSHDAVPDTWPSALLSQDWLPSEGVSTSAVQNTWLWGQDIPGHQLAAGGPGTFFHCDDFSIESA